MSYNVKYYYNFKNISGETYTVQLLHTGSTENTLITGAEDCFQVEYPETKKFEVVKSSGAYLNLLSQTSLQFINLYNNNMFNYQVRLIKDNNILWSGYLDSELYNEPYNEKNNYTVSFTANDGFNLLDRSYFLDNSGNKYFNRKSQWELLQICLNKLALPYYYIYVALSTTSDQVDIYSGTTLLHGVYAICENFYNEDGNPESLRTVLESILKGYGATIKQVNNSLYIYDLNAILTSPTSFKKFNGSTYAYISTDSITTNLGDLTTIKFTSTNSSLDFVNAINKQVIKYSSYNQSTVAKFIANETDFTGLVGYSDYGTVNFQWREFTYNQSKTLNMVNYNSNLFYQMKGIGTGNTDSSAYYIKLDPENTDWLKEYEFKLKPFCYVNSINNPNPVYYLKLAVKAYFRTKYHEDDPSETTISTLKKASIFVNLRCGNAQRYNYVGWGYSGATLSYTNTVELTYYSDNQYSEAIGDQWMFNKTNPYAGTVYNDYYLIPLNWIFSGNMEVQILSSPYLRNSNNSDVSEWVRDIRISEIICEICDSKGNTITQTDQEFSGVLNPMNKNEGEEITLLNGINQFDYPIQNGSLSNYGYNITGFTRQGITTNLENLLLNSVVSNYENPSIKLSVDTPLLSNQIGYLTHSNHLPNKKFVILGSKLNYELNENSLTIVESKPDNLTLLSS
jgi:hypothetical protein